MKCVQISRDGRMDELELPKKNIIKRLIDASKSQGSHELTKIYTWKFEGTDICCYAWYGGDKGFENSHDLPQGGKSDFIDEDSSEITLYGDIFIVKYHNNNIININISDYSVFYSDSFDNFSNYSSDNDDLEDIDIVEKEHDIEDNEIIQSEDKCNYLEYDNYEY
tara:strand:+ start:100 stop:594 length:495 start_codon:yes stop_codon:yes gene_type:complete